MGREESVWRRWGRVGRVEAVGEGGDVRYGGVGM